MGKEQNDKIEIPELVKVVEFVKPDIIHIHGTEENFGLIQSYTSVPVILSIQGILSSITDKYYAGIPARVACKYEPLKNKILRTSLKYNYKRHVHNTCREQEILALTKHICGRTVFDKVITRLMAPESNYYTLQEIIRQGFYNNIWEKFGYDDTLKIVSILNQESYKGFETILKTACILTKAKKLKFEWLVAGISDSNNTVVISEKWLKLKHRNQNIKLLGRLDELSVVELMKTSDIFCQVSHIENSPNSLCEAMLLGIPIVASHVGGTTSLLNDFKEGLVIQDGDAFMLAGALNTIADNFELAAEYGKMARTKALKRHNREQIIQSTLEIYNSVVTTHIS